MSSHRRYEDDKRRDRDSDRRRRSRSRSASPPTPKEKRSADQLPEQFGREEVDDAVEDNKNVLQKMKDSFKDSPLSELQKCIDGSRKIKVYTRNFKEVRGICTGYVLAFDKHWNLILVDADEAYLRPRAAKTPYLEEIDPDKPDLPDLPPRVPKKKKGQAAAEQEDSPDIIEVPVVKDEPMEAAAKGPKAAEVPGADGEKKKKKRKKKKKKKKDPSMGKRNLTQVFIRGDNIVMISIMDEEEEDERPPRRTKAESD